MLPNDILSAAEALVRRMEAKGLTLATAESCTGGLVSAAVTEIPGSSNVLLAGYVTYSNAAKSDLLAVDPGLIERHGAVSAEVARAMAEGALDRSGASFAVSITGIAGPGGATATKPVGLVHFALARKAAPCVNESRNFAGLNRSGVRLEAVRTALRLIADAIAA